jgi:hypothetical protein
VTCVLAILTPASLKSPWVLLELGAAWANAKMTLPLVAGNVSTLLGAMPSPLREPVHGQISDIRSLFRLIDQLGANLGWARRSGAQTYEAVQAAAERARTIWGIDDNRGLPRTDLRRMIIDDAALVGRKIVEWTLDKSTRPKSFPEFKEQLEGGLRIVDPKVTGCELVETPDHKIVIRLPPAHLIKEAMAQYSAKGIRPEDYRFPEFLPIDRHKLMTVGVTAEELFYSFVGNYTTAECE